MSRNKRANSFYFQIIIGGTRDAHDWYVVCFSLTKEELNLFSYVDRYPVARPEITQDILERGLELCPELASLDIRAKRKPTTDDLLPHIIYEGCGFRPARKGGLRLEVEWTEGIGGRRGRVPIIHNYG